MRFGLPSVLSEQQGWIWTELQCGAVLDRPHSALCVGTSTRELLNLCCVALTRPRRTRSSLPSLCNMDDRTVRASLRRSLLTQHEQDGMGLSSDQLR